MDKKRALTKNWLEWTVFILSLGLVAVMFAYLIHDALTIGNAPPDAEVRLGEVRKGEGGYVMTVTVLNPGDQTAEQVAVQVDLYRAGAEPESATLELDFLPRQAERKGWVVFRSDPRTADSVSGYARSFKEP